METNGNSLSLATIRYESRTYIYIYIVSALPPVLIDTFLASTEE